MAFAVTWIMLINYDTEPLKLDTNSREKHMRRVSLLIRQLSQHEKGQDLVEYALLAAFIAVAAGAFLPQIADSVSVIFSKMKSLINNVAQK